MGNYWYYYTSASIVDPVVANLSVCLSNVSTVDALSWIDETVFQIQRKTTVKLALCGFDKLLILLRITE